MEFINKNRKIIAIVLLVLAVVFGYCSYSNFNSPQIGILESEIRDNKNKISTAETAIELVDGIIERCEQGKKDCYSAGGLSLYLVSEYDDLIDKAKDKKSGYKSEIRGYERLISEDNKRIDTIRSDGQMYLVLSVLAAVGGVVLLVTGKKREEPIPIPVSEAPLPDNDNWQCSDCGEINPNSIRICRSCGKDK